RRPRSYLSSLTRDGLRGARLGVVRQLSNVETADPEILGLFEKALADLARQGAVLVDPVRIAGLDSGESLWCNPFKSQLEDYLRSLGPSAPMKSLQEIVESEKYHPSIAIRLKEALEVSIPPEEECRRSKEATSRLRMEVEELFRSGQLAALVYPSWSNPPRKLGDLNSPHGNNSPRLSPPTGFPAVTVPMGFTASGLPAGLQILGEPFSEPKLFQIAYAYEQATLHRRPPASTPPLW
ncbi:MAG TPA: amidase family protein, partial [Vicinamibacteria bacterium]